MLLNATFNCGSIRKYELNGVFRSIRQQTKHPLNKSITRSIMARIFTIKEVIERSIIHAEEIEFVLTSEVSLFFLSKEIPRNVPDTRRTCLYMRCPSMRRKGVWRNSRLAKKGPTPYSQNLIFFVNPYTSFTSLKHVAANIIFELATPVYR